MDLTLSDDQQAVLEAFASFFEKEAPPTVARAAEPLGFDQRLWDRLSETGAPGMGVPEEAGGGGARLAELAIVAELVGRHIAPVPLVEHVATARLLAVAGAPAGLLAEVVAGTVVATLAPRPPVDGSLRVVPAGAVAHAVVALDGDDLVLLRSDPPGVALRNHGCAPLAHRPLDGDLTVLATGGEARALFDRAAAEWQTLMAAALNGVTAAATDLALDYVRTRHQFGVPIGSFQSVQHGLADLPGHLEGTRLLTAKAAWAGDRDEPGVVDVGDNEITDFAALAPMAFLFAADTAALATDRSLHYHGGYGFSEEYDIQLYYRRARTWPLAFDDPSMVCRHLAGRILAEA